MDNDGERCLNMPCSFTLFVIVAVGAIIHELNNLFQLDIHLSLQKFSL